MCHIRLSHWLPAHVATFTTNTDCFLVTADVASLYPNVDTKEALIVLDQLLREARVPETPLLIQLAGLLLIIITYLQNLVRIFFHQVFGIAMGTPVAVTVANAFIFHHEKDIVDYNPPITFRAISLATLRHVVDSYHAITPV